MSAIGANGNVTRIRFDVDHPVRHAADVQVTNVRELRVTDCYSGRTLAPISLVAAHHGVVVSGVELLEVKSWIGAMGSPCKRLSGVEAFAGLRTFSASKLDVVSLEPLRSCSQLERLQLYTCEHLKDATALAACSKLAWLSCVTPGKSAYAFAPVLRLAAPPSLRHLQLLGVRVDRAEFRATLSTLPSMHHLELFLLKSLDDDVDEVAQDLLPRAPMPALTTFKLYGYPESRSVLRAAVRTLGQSGSLERVELIGCRGLDLADTLQALAMPTLAYLDCRRIDRMQEVRHVPEADHGTMATLLVRLQSDLGRTDLLDLRTLRELQRTCALDEHALTYAVQLVRPMTEDQDRVLRAWRAVERLFAVAPRLEIPVDDHDVGPDDWPYHAV